MLIGIGLYQMKLLLLLSRSTISYLSFKQQFFFGSTRLFPEAAHHMLSERRGIIENNF